MLKGWVKVIVKKNIHDVKKNLLINLGYGEEEDWRNSTGYAALSDDEKKEFILQEDGHYCKPAKLPDLTDEELLFLVQLENNKTMIVIKNQLKTVKNCMIFFTTLAVITFLLTLIQLPNM